MYMKPIKVGSIGTRSWAVRTREGKCSKREIIESIAMEKLQALCRRTLTVNVKTTVQRCTFWLPNVVGKFWRVLFNELLLKVCKVKLYVNVKFVKCTSTKF